MRARSLLSMLIWFAAMATAPAPPRAQTPASEREAVMAVVQNLLDSWREADNAKSERVLHPDFRLTTLQGTPDSRKLYTVDRAGLLAASKDLKPGDWDDRLSRVAVRIGSNGLAVMTARYLFYTDGKPGHCGIVVMQLYKVDGEWKIVSFADTHNVLAGKSEAQICPSTPE